MSPARKSNAPHSDTSGPKPARSSPARSSAARSGAARSGHGRARKGDAPSPTFREVVDKVAEKLDEKLTEHASQNERAVAKLTRTVDRVERLQEHLGRVDVWTRVEPAGRKPRWSRDDIAKAAVRIADTEGFAAVSMRRLATELGAGTMTLYHYVRTKDELLSLVMDEIMGEVVVPDDVPWPDDWRAALRMVACRSRDAFARHPWVLDVVDDPPVGPNGVRHFDQTMRAVAGLDLPLAEKVDLVTMVDEYVFGHALQVRNNLRDDGGIDHDMLRYVERLIATGDYPSLAGLAAERGLADAWAEISTALRDPDRFTRNLDRLLASLGP